MKASGESNNEVYSLEEGLCKSLEMMGNTASSTFREDVISTELDRIDEIYIKIGPRQLCAIASRPGAGKTSLALNWAISAATTSDASVIYFTREVKVPDLCMRILSAVTQIFLVRIRSGRLSKDETGLVYNASKRLSKLPVSIDQSGTLELADIRKKCFAVKAERGLDIVIVDYLQLIHSPHKDVSREQEISEITFGLKQLAVDLDCAVLVLAQLNRPTCDRENNVPQVQDLREARSLETHSDILCLLHRDDMYVRNTKSKNIAELLVVKNVDGNIGTIDLRWIGSQVRFAERTCMYLTKMIFSKTPNSSS